MLTMPIPDQWTIKADIESYLSHIFLDPNTSPSQIQSLQALIDAISFSIYNQQMMVYNELMNMHTHQAPSSMIDEEEQELPTGSENDPRKSYQEENEPLPSTKKPLTESEKKELENERDVKPEQDRLQDFFFPNKKKDNVFGSCECGIDSSGSGGRHSSWCPKSRDKWRSLK